METIRSIIKHTVQLILVVIAALWMFFEDWVWDNIRALMEYVGRLKFIKTFEAHLSSQHQYLLLSLFAVPFIGMFPVKLYGLYLIAHGKVVFGVMVFIITKVVATAIVTRLFTISKDKLLLIRPFAVSYYWITAKKEWLYAEVRKLRAWQKAKEIIANIRESLGALISRKA